MADGGSIYRRSSPVGGRYASLNDEHAKGRAQKAAEQAKQRPRTYAELTQAQMRASEAKQQRVEAEQTRAQTGRQLGPNTASMTAERFGKAADTPAQPAMRAAPPAHELRQPHAQGRGAAQPTPGGTVSSAHQPYRPAAQPTQEQSSSRSGAYKVQSIQGFQKPLHNGSTFTNKLSSAGKSQAAAGVSQGKDKELDR